MPGYFVTVGIATGAASLEAAQQAAVGSAVTDAVTYLGIQAEVIYSQTRTQLLTQVTDQITARGAGRVASGRIVEMYYEKRVARSSRPGTVTYDVYVLVAIPMEELEQERFRIENEIQARRDLARLGHQEGLESRQAGDPEAALQHWLHILEVMQGDDLVVSILQEIEMEIAELVADIEITAAMETDPSGQGYLAVSVGLQHGKTTLPAANFPLRVMGLGSGVQREQHIRTDENGKSRIEFNTDRLVGFAAPVEVRVDMERLLGPAAFSPPQESRVVAALGRLQRKGGKVALPPGDRFSPPGASATGLILEQAPEAPMVAGVLLRENPLSGRTQVEGGPVEFKLRAGNPRIFAPGGAPQRCMAYLLESCSSAKMAPGRSRLNLTLLLDVSGSMRNEGKIGYLRQATEMVVENLMSSDILALVTYADEAEVLRQAGSVTNPLLLSHLAEMLRAGGATNLSAGLLEAIQQVELYHDRDMRSRIVMVSDGLANRGITNVEALRSYVTNLAAMGISFSTIGLGENFDEELLMAMAREGGGSYYFVSDSDDLPEILAQELAGLASVVAQNVSVELQLEPGVKFLNSLGIPYTESEQGVSFRLGQVTAGECVRLAFQLQLPSGNRGLHRLGTLFISGEDITLPGRRIEQTHDLMGTYVNHEGREEEDLRSAEYVNQFVHILTIMDSMLLARKSGDPAAIDEILRYLDRELPLLSARSEILDDGELQDVVRMLRHCRMILRAERRSPRGRNMPRQRDLAKEISYKLYRLQHHPAWEEGG